MVMAGLRGLDYAPDGERYVNYDDLLLFLNRMRSAWARVPDGAAAMDAVTESLTEWSLTMPEGTSEAEAAS